MSIIFVFTNRYLIGYATTIDKRLQFSLTNWWISKNTSVIAQAFNVTLQLYGMGQKNKISFFRQKEVHTSHI